MDKCELWAVAAVYLIESGNGKKHYTNIVNYILETEATELIENGAATSQAVNEILKHKVVKGRAVFKSEGSGYYSLEDEGAARQNEDVQNAMEYLKDKKVEVDQPAKEDTEKTQNKDEKVRGDDEEKLSNEARKLSEETRKLSDETRRLSDETMKLSDEVVKLSDENKKLREEKQQIVGETETVREENQQLKEKLESIKQLCG